jgi:hypothetical protein
VSRTREELLEDVRAGVRNATSSAALGSPLSETPEEGQRNGKFLMLKCPCGGCMNSCAKSGAGVEPGVHEQVYLLFFRPEATEALRISVRTGVENVEKRA